MTAKIIDAANNELMTIEKLERDGNNLVIRGKIYGTMPMTAKLSPQETRNALKLLRPKMLFFILSLVFRKG